MACKGYKLRRTQQPCEEPNGGGIETTTYKGLGMSRRREKRGGAKHRRAIWTGRGGASKWPPANVRRGSFEELGISLAFGRTARLQSQGRKQQQKIIQI